MCAYNVGVSRHSDHMQSSRLSLLRWCLESRCLGFVKPCACLLQISGHSKQIFVLQHWLLWDRLLWGRNNSSTVSKVRLWQKHLWRKSYRCLRQITLWVPPELYRWPKLQWWWHERSLAWEQAAVQIDAAWWSHELDCGSSSRLLRKMTQTLQIYW